METTFITIHDLSPQAHILYSSDSIVDVLGYAPEDVLNRSCWDFFHPEEVPLAKRKHDRGVKLDKAAMLNYCRMKDRDGNYLGCEVVFTVVYDVLVGCTSIYRRGLKSNKRAAEAPVVRRLFSTSPKDPRYHMLSHLSSKFAAPSEAQDHEPRAALFLNRYTRTLTIMYATNGLADILGISGEEMKGHSFYYCIQDNCLQDAIRCLENAKSNDSIAYLRFWFIDPRRRAMEDARALRGDAMDIDDPPRQNSHSSDNDSNTHGSRRSRRREPFEPYGGLAISSHDRTEHHAIPGLERHDRASADSQAVSSEDSVEPMDTSGQNLAVPIQQSESRGSSGQSDPNNTYEAIFGEPADQDSSASSASPSSNGRADPVELEAVVSCTSDGLVVCLRRAKACTPLSALPQQQPEPQYANGMFAVPWATHPILPAPASSQHAQQQAPQPERSPAPMAQAQQASARRDSGPPTGSDFMNSIRDIAIFAWALVGINGSLAAYSTGSPRGESQPAAGLPIWQPNSTRDPFMSNGANHNDTRPNGYHPVSSHSSSEHRTPENTLPPINGTHAQIMNSTFHQLSTSQSAPPRRPGSDQPPSDGNGDTPPFPPRRR